jgi:transposase
MSDLPVLDSHAAFVDVGSEQMHVSVAGGPPEVFGTVTSQLHALRDWLRAQGVRSVAMEATGVYWLPLYGVLEATGFEVLMVNGRQTRNLPGRKSDIQDCQWGATLHAHGLLRAGFVPPAHIRRIQDYMRLRADHIAMAATHVQHMQQAVVRAILGGERDPQRLLALCDIQIQRAKADRVKESLRGTWTEEHLFALRQALQSWEHYQVQISECDRRVEALLHEIEPRQPPNAPALAGRRSRPGVNAPDIPDLRAILAQICGGQDLTQLPAHTEYSVLQIIAEVGTDLNKWPTEKHFTSWTGLAPGSHQSGKRKRSVKRGRNRVGRLFCLMARSLARSKDIALGGFYRRMAARRGGLIANIALARKLAGLFWRVMVKGMNYVERGLQQYEAKVLETKQRSLRRLARQLGQKLVPIPTPGAKGEPVCK